jgi:hypothetical protein
MRKAILQAFFSLLLTSGFGQENRLHDHNTVGWYIYNGDHKLANRWELHTEYQWRRVDIIRSWQQSLARLGLIYKLTDRVKVSGGYTLFITYPYGNYPSADVPVPEHRIYEDILLNDQLGRLKLAHRFRLEQRWLGQPSEENPRKMAGWAYQNRVRYQLSGTFPLNGPTIDDGEFYLNALAGVEAGKRGGMFVVGLGSPDVLTQADLVVPSLETLTVDEVLEKASV